MTWYETIIAAHTAVTQAVSHGQRLKSSRYFVWQEDGSNDLEASDGHAEGAVQGTTDLFTKQLSDTCRFTADISPNRAGSWSCGTSDRPWSDVYAENGTIQTSDENQKNSIEPLPEKYVAMLDHISPKRYKLDNGTSGRYHVGFIAQDVEEAMTLAGIDSTEFGGWIQDQDEEGNTIYMLRYNEFMAIILAKLRSQSAEIDALKSKLGVST